MSGTGLWLGKVVVLELSRCSFKLNVAQICVTERQWSRVLLWICSASFPARPHSRWRMLGCGCRAVVLLYTSNLIHVTAVYSEWEPFIVHWLSIFLAMGVGHRLPSDNVGLNYDLHKHFMRPALLLYCWQNNGNVFWPSEHLWCSWHWLDKVFFFFFLR